MKICHCALPSIKGPDVCKTCSNNSKYEDKTNITVDFDGYNEVLKKYYDDVRQPKSISERLRERPSWQKTFIDIAKVVAKRSKDPNHQVGSVLVKNNCIIATGYNGDPRNFRYNFNWNTEEKYDYVIHSELNAIANAVYNGAGNSIKDGEIYLTLSPCHNCILLLIQFGIKKVYYLEKYKDFELTKKIADNADIELIKINEEEL